MDQKTQPQKLCWNCDGNIDIECTRCPYCAISQDRQEEQEFTPPYSCQAATEQTEKQAPSESPLRPMSMLLSGSFCLLFGLILFLYSGQPQLVLSWNTSMWPLVLAPAAPLLYYGWRQLPQD